MSAAGFDSGFMDEFKSHGCLKVLVTDRKKLAAQKVTAARAAFRLGRAIHSSYRYPWLYVHLGDKLQGVPTLLTHIGPRRLAMDAVPVDDRGLAPVCRDRNSH